MGFYLDVEMKRKLAVFYDCVKCRRKEDDEFLVVIEERDESVVCVGFLCALQLGI